MTPPRPHRRLASRLHPLLGVGVGLAALVILYVAFNANRSLPFREVYRVVVELPDASKLAPTNDVRVAGVRVGQVREVEAVPAGAGRPARARISLDLQPDVGPLPSDSVVKVRPASVLGTNYLDLVPGTGGETVPPGGTLPWGRSRSTVELPDLLDVFDRSTARSTRQALTSLGRATAGRGVALNPALASLAHLLAPLEEVAETLHAPSTRLARLVGSYRWFIDGLEPAAPELASLFGRGARTFAALGSEREALGAAIDAAAPAERSITSGLVRLQPALDGLAALTTDLRPAARILPGALDAASTTVAAGVRPLRLLPPLTGDLRELLGALGRLSRRPVSSGALRKLTDAWRELMPTLNRVVPAQVQCNVVSLFAQSFGTAYGTTGFGMGPPMAHIAEKHLGSVGESLQNAAPSPGLAVNVNPNENYDECESGNEPYPYAALPVFNGPGEPLLGNPPGLQDNETLDTYPPEGVHDLARGVGLLPTLESNGARPFGPADRELAREGER